MEREKNIFKKTVFVCPTKCYCTHYWNLENLNLERMADSGDDFCDVTNNIYLIFYCGHIPVNDGILVVVFILNFEEPWCKAY